MKIGVHFGFGVPEGGGQFTLQQSIGKAVLKLAKESRHTFVIFGGPNVFKESQGNIKYSSFPRSIIIHMYSRFYKTIAHIANSNRIAAKVKSIFANYLESKTILKSGVDIIWYVGPFCYTMEIPYIYILLDLQHLLQPYFPEVSGKGVWKARQKHYEEVLRRATRIIISTEVGKDEVERFYQIPSERIVVSPYASPEMDMPISNEDTEQILLKYQIPPNYLFYPAQFWPQKNHVGLLRAVRLLRDKWNIESPVVFVGSDKGNLAYVKKVVHDLDLKQQVYFLGFVPRNDLNALYKNAFALTMPTLVGPDNIPSLEAFSFGCPVISSNIAGFEEQLGDAALLVDPANVEQIALAIKSLHDDEQMRNSLIKRGLQLVSKWSWDDYVKQVLASVDEFEHIRQTWPTNSQNSIN